ncbi:MAG: hypothetical protein PHO29_07085 [Acetobacterium sp.]|nr:hypothetical protein [Acetobacterium sp.]
MPMHLGKSDNRLDRGCQCPAVGGLSLAVEEAMANVIKYGFDQEGQHYFDLAIEVD